MRATEAHRGLRGTGHLGLWQASWLDAGFRGFRASVGLGSLNGDEGEDHEDDNGSDGDDCDARGLL